MATFFDAAKDVKETFVVGGQALNIWAERYCSRNENLTQYAPYTSVDLDYFGTRDAAQKISKLVGGQLKVPELGDNTPNTALIIAELDGQELIVDFIDHVLGVHDKDIRKMVAIIALPMTQNGQRTNVAISVMHPFHCLVSRFANVMSPALRRRDATAFRQLNASVHVLCEFINDLLNHGERGRASKILRMLYHYLRSDRFGRNAHKYADTDPIRIINTFHSDDRLHPKFRPYLAVWSNEILGRRRNREAREQARKNRQRDQDIKN